MRIIGLTVARNEEHRYLRSMLRSVEGRLDGHLVYDDRSTDRTANIAKVSGCTVVIRPEGQPSFADCEGSFRQQALDWVKHVFEPTEDDWVLVVDADETLTGKRDLRMQACHATLHGHDACQLKIREIWDNSDPATPQERRDHQWGVVTGVRLWRWRDGARYVLRDPEGNKTFCGHVPDRFDRKTCWADGVELWHWGHSDPADRQERYDRYIKDSRHAFTHVKSILERPVLRPVKVDQEVRRGE